MEKNFFITHPNIEYVGESLQYQKLPTTYFIPRLFEFIPITTLLLLIVLLLSFHLTAEYREKTIYFLNSFPYKREYLLLDKTSTTVVWVFFSWLLACLSLVVLRPFNMDLVR